MPKRTWMVAVALAAVGMVVATQSLAAADDDRKQIITEETGAGPVPGGFASWAELMAFQEKLDQRAEKISAARDASFAGIEVLADQRRMNVYWKGEPSADAAAAIADARRDGFQVELRPAEFSEAELMAEGEKIIENQSVTAVAPKVDGSSLLVSQLPGSLPLMLFAAVPLSMDEADPALAANRRDDASPYKGGARWNGCSTGFAISIKGAKKMLSAGHCGSNGQTARDGGGQTMGTISGDSNPFDRLYINTSSQGRVYNGAVNLDGSSPANEFSNRVIGATQSFVGNFICSSGAYSGTRCNSRVVATNQTINTGYLIFETVRAEQQDRQAAIGNGDSGGPSFAVASDNTKVIAKGTHTAIDLSTARPCTGSPSVVNGRQCAWRFWYVDVTRSLSAYQAKIVTG